ncbi:MAG: histidine kinase [Bacteroidetes bacterium]|nr:histidine kinase [Bacteroidota bacterium]
MNRHLQILLTPELSIFPDFLLCIYAAEMAIAFFLVRSCIRLYVQMKTIRLQLKQDEQDIKIQAANAGIHPHFIQNMFEFVIGNIKNKTAEKSLAIINDIGAYLKRTLGNDQQSMVPLLEELENARQYMDIQLRMNPGQFSYGFFVLPTTNLRQIMVPHMLLQPVIENCIKHGFNGIQYEGFIAINIDCKDNIVTISIKDNGRGLKDDWSKDKIGYFTRKSKGVAMPGKRLLLAVHPKHAGKVNAVLQNRTDKKNGSAFIIQFPVQQLN